MKLCSENHEEIVYNCRKCPICEQIKMLESTTKELENTIEEQSDIIDELEHEEG